jgi:predicted acyl esterase
MFDPGGLNQINRPENEWPLARTKYEKLYLDASSGSLSPQPVSRESQTQYSAGSGQANFVIRFDQETELTGYMKLRLWVEAKDADDLDLFIYVQKFDRRGEFLPNLILRCPHPGAQGWLRVSHRELDPQRSTPSEPYLTHRRLQLLRPKEIVPVEIGIWPTSMLWHLGQQLRVIVSGHYIETRGPDWWESFRYESLDRGTCIIHTGGRYDSHLLVPSIPVTSGM